MCVDITAVCVDITAVCVGVTAVLTGVSVVDYSCVLPVSVGALLCDRCT